MSIMRTRTRPLCLPSLKSVLVYWILASKLVCGADAFCSTPAGLPNSDGTVNFSAKTFRRASRHFQSTCWSSLVRPRNTAGSPSSERSPLFAAAKDDVSESEWDEDSLLGGQAMQALEFWKTRQPSPALPPREVVGLLMTALQRNDHPEMDDGLKTVFDFSSGMCRRAVGGSADRFIKEARYSVFGATLCCQSFELDPMQEVGDRLATQVVSVVSSDGRRRRFLWTLERQRRPPDTGKWLIYGVVSSDIDGTLTMDG